MSTGEHVLAKMPLDPDGHGHLVALRAHDQLILRRTEGGEVVGEVRAPLTVELASFLQDLSVLVARSPPDWRLRLALWRLFRAVESAVGACLSSRDGDLEGAYWALREARDALDDALLELDRALVEANHERLRRGEGEG